MRKGQRLCNYIQMELRTDLPNEEVHQVLFDMSDEEFDKGLKFKKGDE